MDKKNEINLASRAKEVVRYKRTVADNIISEIPGFGKHSEKDMLRKSDQLVRDSLSRELRSSGETLREIFKISQDISRPPAERDWIEKAFIKIDTIEEKMRHASRGYSPMSGAIKVDELALSRRVDYDASFEASVLELKKEAQDLKTAVLKKEEIIDSVLKINAMLDQMDDEFNARDESLRMG